ncbi:MAG: CDP-glucose 4,6-dehydratase [Planctomycetaceae bacterium]|jgi:CDP-glucose 4,6-dehydratase|nr:CDP-glucose 4,6-dehydratase [Planctomycetaceae bacterium]
MSAFNNIYQSSKVFLTGHSGFKGTWMTEWLSQLGAAVAGYSLPGKVSEPDHFSVLNPKLEQDYRGDIRNYELLQQAISETQPDIVFHFAAQPLVNVSYQKPLDTFSTNVLGTANLLEACRNCESIKAVVVITSDKCYKNKEQKQGYRETDELGGVDPYSASKACAELTAQSYRSSYPALPPVATARAGNVIGGGDWSQYRLVPDLIRSAISDKITIIRKPAAVRPWQFVLEPLYGYLLLGQKLLEEGRKFAEPWNFGPAFNAAHNTGFTVLELAEKSSHSWNRIRFEVKEDLLAEDITRAGGGNPLIETGILLLDSSKSQQQLNWKPLWSIEKSVQETIRWYKTFAETGKVITVHQIAEYTESIR